MQLFITRFHVVHKPLKHSLSGRCWCGWTEEGSISLDCQHTHIRQHLEEPESGEDPYWLRVLSSFVQYSLMWVAVLNVGWIKVKSCKWIYSAKVKEYGQFVLNLCSVKGIWWSIIMRWLFSCLGASKSSNWCKWWVWHNAASGWTRKQERCVLIYRVSK